MRVWGKPTNQNNTWEDGMGGGDKGLPQCVSRAPLQAPPPTPDPTTPTTCSPCDHVRSEAEHKGADEGADLPGGSLSSPPLLLQATLADTGNRSTSAGWGTTSEGTSSACASVWVCRRKTQQCM